MTATPSTDEPVSTQPIAVRCASCHEEWTLTTNLLTGDPIWTPPKKKRGGCAHPISPIEYLTDETREWTSTEVVTPNE